MLGSSSEAGSYEESAEFVAVESTDVLLVVEARPADMDSWRVIEKLLLDGVAVEAGDRAKPPGNVARALPRSSRSRPKHSMSTRLASKRRMWCPSHQVANWRKSKAYASLVSPL